MTLLIDIDIDFLPTQRFNEQEDPRRPEVDELRLHITPAELVAALKVRGYEARDSIPIVDHSEALRIWQRMGIRNAHVIHIDAHSDLYGIFHSWETDRVHRGNYLRFALELGIVSSITLVVPLWMDKDDFWLHDCQSEALNEVGRRCTYSLEVCHLHELKQANTVCELVTVAQSPFFAPVMLDSYYHEMVGSITDELVRGP